MQNVRKLLRLDKKGSIAVSLTVLNSFSNELG